MRKLFQKIDEEQKRSIRFPILLTQKEAEKIRFSAKTRDLSVAEFIRRAALSRKADLRYEIEIVQELREVTQTIRRIHADLVEKKMSPSEIEDWLPAIEQATATMLKISK